MCVMYTLHEHALARQLADVWMVIPKRVTVTASIVFMPEFLERRHVIVLFEEIDYPTSDDAVDITKDCFGFLVAIGDEMEVIRHDDVPANRDVMDRFRLLAERGESFVHRIRGQQGTAAIRAEGHEIDRRGGEDSIKARRKPGEAAHG